MTDGRVRTWALRGVLFFALLGSVNLVFRGELATGIAGTVIAVGLYWWYRHGRGPRGTG